MKTKSNNCSNAQAPLLVNASNAAKMLGICRATLWRRMAQGNFPRPVRLGACVRWRVSDLEAWVAADCISLDSVRVSE